MKKIYLALIMALMYILGVTASAEESGYTPGVNSYTSSTLEGAKSVIIYKGADRSDIRSENIYYIDQADRAEGFANLELLMKLDAPAGTYTVVVDGMDAPTFTISDAEAYVSGAEEVEFLGAEKQSDNSYSVGFGINAEGLLTTKTELVMVIGENAYITDLFGDNSIIKWGGAYPDPVDGKLMFAIQIDGVSAEHIIDESGNITPDLALYSK